MYGCFDLPLKQEIWFCYNNYDAGDKLLLHRNLCLAHVSCCVYIYRPCRYTSGTWYLGFARQETVFLEQQKYTV